ncbi:MAG: DUF192 domain-containing protein [Phormidesmis sp.]
MRLFQRISDAVRSSQSGSSLRCMAVLATLSMMLMSCSMPDGPPPPTDDPAMAAAEPAAPPEITLSGPGQLLPVTAMADLKGETFELEVAQTSEQQSLGLMFRSELPANRGMLFPFGSPRRTRFWMKDVPVPLDMVFLRNGVVVAIAQAPPCPAEPCPTYGPDNNQLVDQVLELRGGRAAEIGLQTGDAIAISALP